MLAGAGTAQLVHAPVLEDVADGVGGFARRLQQVRVVAVREDGAAAAHHAVERACHADLQPLHGAAQGRGIGRLHDHVQVVSLDREVDEAETEARAAAGEGAPQGAETAVGAEIPDLGSQPRGDVQGATAKSPAQSVRDVLAAALRLATGPAARTAPTIQGKLLLLWFHGASVQRGSDIAGMCAHSS